VKLTAMIVDDEAPARRRLVRLLEEIADVEVVAVVGDPHEALARLAEPPPDVLFLDINMPGLDGLTLAERAKPLPAVVFVTAHAEHAARAFDLDSTDYLLKPVRPERLEEAVRKIRRRRQATAAPAGPAVPADEASTARVVAYERGTTVFVDARAVTRFRSSDKYTAFLADGRELLTEESLVALEARLAPFGFVRVHRAELVQLSAVKALRVDDGVHSLRLDDDQIVPVSRRMAASLRERLRT